MGKKARTDPFEELKNELKRGMGDREGRDDRQHVKKNGVLEEERWAPLPCADMTCPCRVLKKQEILLPERCLKR